MIDCHTHVGLHGFAIGEATNETNERNDPFATYNNALDAYNPLDFYVEEARNEGITTISPGPGSVNPFNGSFIAVKTYGITPEEFLIKDNVAMKIAFGFNPKNRYKEKKISSRMTIAAFIRSTLYEAKQYLAKKEAANGDVTKEPTYSAKYEALIPVLKKEIPLKAHAHTVTDILTAIRIAKEFDVKLTIEHCTAGRTIAEYLGKQGYPIAAGPVANPANKPEVADKSWETAGILDNAGCHVSITCDAPVTLLSDLRISAGRCRAAGMNGFHALQAITIHPAEHIGIADRVGSIEVGKDADFLITDGDALSIDTHILSVYINGKKVK